MQAENFCRRQLALTKKPESAFDGADAVCHREQRANVGGGEQERLSFRFHAELPSNRVRSVPESTSCGATPRWNTRAWCGPLSTAVPFVCRIHEPSRSPMTGGVFSSRNCRIRSSCVSPICLEVGSGSWKCGLIWYGKMRSASNEGGWTIGISFVVLMVGPATFEPALEPM